MINPKAERRKLEKGFDKAICLLDDKEIQDALLGDAKDLRDDARARAPRGTEPKPLRGAKKGYGPLWQAIVAKRFRRKRGRAPAVFVAADKKIAFYAHLVEYGHALVKGGSLKKGKGKGRVIGTVPARPFFRPAVDSFRGFRHLENAVRRKFMERR